MRNLTWQFAQTLLPARAPLVDAFDALRLAIDNWRWSGVPFLLRTGKAMQEHDTHVVLRFRSVPQADRHELRDNHLLLGISPKEDVSLAITAKCPGPAMNFGAVPLSFDYGAHFNAPPQTGYETLLYDVLIGDRTPFRSQAYVESCWRVVDPLLKSWPSGPLETYEAGSYGPAGADRLARPLGWLKPTRA